MDIRCARCEVGSDVTEARIFDENKTKERVLFLNSFGSVLNDWRN